MAGPFFSDWINVWQQFEPGQYPDYLGGRVISVEGAASFSRSRFQVVDQDTGALDDAWVLAGDADLEYSVAKFAQHRGSFETSIMVRFVDGRLEVRGNPSSYGRLDNLFGIGLDQGIAVYNEILADLGLPQFTEGEVLRHWSQRDEKWVTRYTGAHLTRVDMTCNVSVGMGRVRDLHRWLARQKLYRSAPGDRDLEQFQQWDFSTVVMSLSKYWMNVKAYDKGAQIEAILLPQYRRKLKQAEQAGRIDAATRLALLTEAEEYLSALACWCSEIGLSRLEYSLKSRWFNQKPELGFWQPGLVEQCLLEIVQTEFNRLGERAMVHQVYELDNLTRSEKAVYFDWKRGLPVADLEQYGLSKPTFYRIRSSILKKTGDDIAARPVDVSSALDYRPVYFPIRSVSVTDAPAFYRRAA